jgi:DNA polymerase-3 subunit gamma/tau
MFVNLYQKYRPRKFSEIVGQENVSTILKNSIKLNRLNNSYIFSGPKGTGKTSIAKIFAKALNCLNNNEGDACDNCEHCRLINENKTIDIVELDGASNNGVDEIRKIIDSAATPPFNLDKKVFIIDEAHMLTTQA